MTGMATSLGKKLREFGFVPYFAAVFVGFFFLLSLVDLAFQLIFPDSALDFSSYAAWDVPVNLGLSAIVAMVFGSQAVNRCFKINKADITKLDLDK